MLALLHTTPMGFLMAKDHNNQPPGGSTGIKFTEEIITPVIAKDWLERLNVRNRQVKRKHVEALARKMSKPEGWRVNAEAIMFSKSGFLINGQHRLESVILSGATIRSIVARDVPDDAYETLDQGAKRRASDELYVAGVHNAHKVASTAKIILIWNENLPVRTGLITKDEIASFVEKNPELVEMATAVNTTPRPPGPASGIAAVGWMATRTKEYVPLWDTFLDKLRTGADLPDASPILALRNFIIS